MASNSAPTPAPHSAARSLAGVPESHGQSVVLAVAALIFLCGTLSPPSLMDDVDAVHGAIARTMLRSGDWVTARINGVVYLDKSPLTYWLIAASYAVFGIHDWAARLPLALAAILLCWITARFGGWAFSPRAGFYAGLALATSVGLFLFTRILIPEVILTLTVSLALCAFLRLQEETEPHRGRWVIALGAALGAGLLLKGLLGVVAPAGAIFLYLLGTRQLFSWTAWRRFQPLAAGAVALLIAAPWYIAATLANPPYFDLTFTSGEGIFRGFFWRYFINEQLLRYLGERLPKDYDTVPLIPFWLLHLVWLFPWSAYLPAAARLSYKPVDRAGRVRLMALCWAAFLLVFFSFSTSQEYYTMPIYPALALLIASGIESEPSSNRAPWIRYGTVAAGIVLSLAALACAGILAKVWSLPAEGDISSALIQNPDAYTLSLGHVSDLTLNSFAYLRLPLALAALAFAIGAAGCWIHACAGDTKQKMQGRQKKHGKLSGLSLTPPWLAFALMMILFTNAARLALVAFDPHLSSRPLAEALRVTPPGTLLINGAYYPFSSVVYYADRDALLLNGRFNNLEYGSNAPGAPDVFINDARFVSLWRAPERRYLLCIDEESELIARLIGGENLYPLLSSGGKTLFTNHPLP